MFDDDNEFICRDPWCKCPHKPMPIEEIDNSPRTLKDYAMGIIIP